MNPKNTVFDAKRLIGRRFDDQKIQEDIKHWPFTVVCDGDKPKIQVRPLNYIIIIIIIITIINDFRLINLVNCLLEQR